MTAVRLVLLQQTNLLKPRPKRRRLRFLLPLRDLPQTVNRRHDNGRFGIARIYGVSRQHEMRSLLYQCQVTGFDPLTNQTQREIT